MSTGPLNPRPQQAAQGDARKDKGRMTADFNRAAAGYDRISEFQRTVADRLLERLELMRIDPARVLDLGSGTGHAAQALAKRYRRARILELDIAIEMLRRGRPSRWRRVFSRRSAACADAERLPFDSAAVDLVFSSLMLQWIDDVAAVFREVARVLRPGGLFIFSSLGPDTLAELRKSWARVDDVTHVHTFIDMHDLGDALVEWGLADPVMEMEPFTLTYADGRSLMHDLRALGAANVNLGRRRTLTGKSRMARMLEAYEQYRHDGRLPATYEVIYGHAWRTEMARPVEPGTAVFPIAALSGRSKRG